MMSGQLPEFARNVGLSLSDAQVGQLEAHLSAVLEANKTLNLTAIRRYDDAIRLHVLDSLLVGQVLSEAPDGRILDIGTGAGYPGIPLAVISGRETVLLEATQKKCDFLEQCLQDTEIPGVSVARGRAEELALDEQYTHRFSVITSRAVGDLPILLELAAPFLEYGGLVLALKGALGVEEEERGDFAAQLLGMHRQQIHRYILPGGDESRSIVVFERVGDPEVCIPRRPGMAKKRPLG